jgi:hypothetical protein
MPKANRTCYCCGREYYFCPSCPSDRKDPQIYTMFDSEICKDVFNTLVKESTKNITTKECKEKLVELGVGKIDIKKDSVKKHINRVMGCEDVVEETRKEENVLEALEVIEVIKVSEVDNSAEVETVEVAEKVDADTVEVVEETPKMMPRKKKSSYKNKNNE